MVVMMVVKMAVELVMMMVVMLVMVDSTDKLQHLSLRRKNLHLDQTENCMLELLLYLSLLLA